MTWAWARKPADGEPGRVVIGTKAGTVREYATELTDDGARLGWADGRDAKWYRVGRDWTGAWACDCPDARGHPGRSCKHVICIAHTFDEEGW